MNTSRRVFLRNLLFGVKSSEEQTLVCIFLRGGADTLNIVVPYGDDDYYNLRPTIHIPAPKKNVINSSVQLDNFYAFHPKMSSLFPIFEEGRFGVVQGVGSDNLSGSHFEAQDQMEHGGSYHQDFGSGWLGRHLLYHGKEHAKAISAVAIGTTVPECLRGAPNINVIEDISDLDIRTATKDSKAVIDAIAKMYGQETSILGKQGQDTLQLLSKLEELKKEKYAPQYNAEYPQNNFGKGLLEIARLIKAGLGLEAACLDLGGWDTHFFQGQENGLQAGNIEILAKGLAAFDADVKDHRHKITTIVMTEFGRRVYENSSLGTDHGRAFSFFAIGDKINGGKVHGQWAGLKNNDSEEGPGGLKITCDYRSVLSEILAEVFQNKKIDQIFPGFTPERTGLVKSR